MPNDYTAILWCLKLGALVNLWFLAASRTPGQTATDPHLLVPAQILFLVSGYRCLFPNRYENNTVFHDSVLSSALVTRVIATFSEVAYIYQFAYVLRLLNLEDVGWIDGLATLMVLQVILSQCFVWSAILTGRLALYVYEELGWAVIFLANTLASAYLYASLDLTDEDPRLLLLRLSLGFGAVYLPWQMIHLNALRKEAKEADVLSAKRRTIGEAVSAALVERNRSTDAAAWGGVIGLTWMTAYWASLIPLWVYLVVRAFAPA